MDLDENEKALKDFKQLDMYGYAGSNKLENYLRGLKCLGGKKLNDTLYELKFENFLFRIETDGDCCSNSWIEHVEGEEVLFETPILAVELVDVDSWWQNSDGVRVEEDEGNLIQTYMIKIRTQKGYFEMEYRNDSNGYYGAGLNFYKKRLTKEVL